MSGDVATSVTHIRQDYSKFIAHELSWGEATALCVAFASTERCGHGQKRRL